MQIKPKSQCKEPLYQLSKKTGNISIMDKKFVINRSDDDIKYITYSPNGHRSMIQIKLKSQCKEPPYQLSMKTGNISIMDK